ncbi:MAG: hypothetical protein LBR89_04750 [Holosporales bacterium]|jgi:hypothetical protein|nr:hypothetical protein [Holosporales bacterium]
MNSLSKTLTLALISCFAYGGTSGYAQTGFFAGFTVGWVRSKVEHPNSATVFGGDGSKKSESAPTKSNRVGCNLVVGYSYGRTLFLAGQVSGGYSGGGIKQDKSVTWDENGETYNAKLGAVLRNTWNVGTEVHIGARVGSIAAVYGIAGVGIESMKVRGQITASGGDESYVLYFEKNATTVNGFTVPAIKQSTKLVPVAVFGAGAMVTVCSRFMVGLEGRYYINRSVKIKTNGAFVGEKSGQPVNKNMVEDLPIKFNNFSVAAKAVFYF